MSIAPAASRLANVFNGDVPSRVENVLSLDGIEFTSLAYNSRGTYLAAGTDTGELVIWDLVTLSPALRIVNLHSKEINGVSWVKKSQGRLVCTTSSDGWMKVFDLERRIITIRLHFDEEIVGAAIHPTNLDLALVALGASSSEPGEIPWPALYRVDDRETKPLVKYVPKDFYTELKTYGVATTFSKNGRLVFSGGVAGQIFTFATDTGEHLRTFVPDSARGLSKNWLVALTLSRNGRVLVSDGQTKVLCVYDVASDLLDKEHDVLPANASVDMIQDAMRWRAGHLLTFKKHLLDVVGNSKWSDVGCSGHSEFVMAAAKGEIHEIFVWDVSTGLIVGTLQDKGNTAGGISRIMWHPWRPQIAVVMGSGDICLWGAKSSDELAFGTNFTEIEENIIVQDAPEEEERVDAKMEVEHQIDPVDVLNCDSFPEMFSESENSDEDEPSCRVAPRSITRNIGYFIPATVDNFTVDATDL